MRECRAGGLETLDLRPVDGILGDLRRDEMADQQVGPASRAMSLHRRLQRHEGFEAEPVHAGVEMERGWRGPAALGGEGGPAGEFVLAADHRRKAMLRVVRRIGPALEAVQHIDRGAVRQDAARRNPFAQMGDEEDARPGGPQRGRRLGDAGPVSIGLDDGRAAPRRDAARQLAPVVAKRAKVDHEPPRSVHGRDAVFRPKRSRVPNLHGRM